MWRELDAQARGGVLVWAAVLIMAAANAVLALLTEWGARYPLNDRNAVTPCNVLLVGSFCAFVVLVVVHRQAWRRANLRALGRSDWLGMTVGRCSRARWRRRSRCLPWSTPA